MPVPAPGRRPAVRELLQIWLDRAVPAPAAAWLRESAARLAADAGDRDVYRAFGEVVRRVGKDDLALSAADLAAARQARPDWDPAATSVDQAARLLLVLALAEGPRFAERLEQLFATADLGELIAFYRGLPLFPQPEAWLARAGEGARSNIRAVFEAVAHRNPYPAERFPEAAWNQMVLKALFVGASLFPIQGIDRRHNPELARMVVAFAHERRAAGRPVSPELWRCVGRFADGDALADLAAVLATGSATERAAAALALAAAPGEEARRLLATVPLLARAIAERRLTWDAL